MELNEIKNDEKDTNTLKPDAPTNEELLNLIDREIEFYFQCAQRPGWTKWALYASFGGVMWLCLENFKNGFAMPQTILLCLVFILSIDVFTYLTNFLLGTQRLSSRSPKRFVYFIDYLERLDTSLLLIPFLMVKYSALLILGAIFGPSEWFPYKLLYAFYNGTLLIFLALVVPYIMFRLPTEFSKDKRNWVDYWLLGFNIIIGGGAMYGFTIFAFSGFEVTFEHVRFSLLITASITVLGYIAKEPELPASIHGLVQVRRDLSLKKMTPEIAANEMRIIFAGLSASDILEADAAVFRKNLSKINELLNEADIQLLQFVAFAKDKKDRAPDDVKKMFDIIAVWKRLLDEAGGLIPRALLPTFKRHRLKTSVLRGSNKEIQGVVDSHLSKVGDELNNAADRYLESVNTYNNAVKSLKEGIQIGMERMREMKSNKSKEQPDSKDKHSMPDA